MRAHYMRELLHGQNHCKLEKVQSETWREADLYTLFLSSFYASGFLNSVVHT